MDIATDGSCDLSGLTNHVMDMHQVHGSNCLLLPAGEKYFAV
jgi:hypothetical protein